MPEAGTPSARILVVDDVAANARLLCDVLTYEGCTVVLAGSGEAALQRLAAEEFDLVLLDVLMPGIDGYATCRAIRAGSGTEALPVVMVTSLDAREERVKGLEAGADDFLSKPVNRQELLARVRSLLRIKRLHDQTRRQAGELARWAATLEARVAEGVAQVERLSRLKRFFSPHVAEMIVGGRAGDPLRSRRREIAVVYIDLRGFTAFAETAEPEEVMRVLGLYHAAIGRLVVMHEATLERFTGDGMMMFFGDPLPVPDPARRAVALALALRKAATEISNGWRRQGVDLGFSIGIAQGYATVGAIGFEGRIDYGAIGTVTNLASRLCQRAQPGEILLSQRVFAGVEGTVEVEDAGELALHGFSRPVHAYRCIAARGSDAE
jgi:class 3 adenylate cyclase/ActR/RegA family two-component response regulator